MFVFSVHLFLAVSAVKVSVNSCLIKGFYWNLLICVHNISAGCSAPNWKG